MFLFIYKNFFVKLGSERVFCGGEGLSVRVVGLGGWGGECSLCVGGFRLGCVWNWILS